MCQDDVVPSLNKGHPIPTRVTLTLRSARSPNFPKRVISPPIATVIANEVFYTLMFKYCSPMPTGIVGTIKHDKFRYVRL